jgi:hypothetical protein
MDVHPAANSEFAKARSNWKTKVPGVQMMSRFIDLEIEGSGLTPEKRREFFGQELALDSLQAFRGLT